MYRRGAAKADPGICVGGGRPLPFPILSPRLLTPPFPYLLRLEAGPLKPARGSGEAL